MGPHRNGIYTEGPRVAAMRRVLCARVAECPGVIKGIDDKPECWALGAAAIKKVLTEVTSG